VAATRVVVILAVAAVTLCGVARADDRVSVGTTVHTDSDELLVVHPAATARIELPEEVHLSAGYQADVISAATIDVRTAASTRPFEEVRHGASAGVELAPGRLTTLTASYSLSVSPDYLSNALSLRLAQEDDTRTHTFTVGLAGAHDSVGRVGDPRPTGDAFGVALSARWAMVLCPEAVADVGAAVEHQRGFLESPYRFVTVGGAGSQVRLPEEVPDLRWRGAVRAGLRWALAAPLFVRAQYRLHVDDWGVLGHTFDVAGHLAPGPGWRIMFGGSSLAQRGATFYSGRYATLPDVPVLRTRDRTLAPHWTLTGRLGVRVPFARVGGFELGARVHARVDWHRYFDTPVLPERTSLSVGPALLAER